MFAGYFFCFSFIIIQREGGVVVSPRLNVMSEKSCTSLFTIYERIMELSQEQLPDLEYEGIKTPSELLEYMSNNIRYGFVGRNGKKYFAGDEDWDSDWYEQCIVQPGIDVLKTKCGTCWDQVELERMWFESHGYEFKTIFLWFEVNSENDLPTHTILVYKNNDKWNYFEHSFGIHKGITQHDSLSNLLDVLRQNQIQHAINSGKASQKDVKYIKFYEYSKPKDNSSVAQYLDHVSSGVNIY